MELQKGVVVIRHWRVGFYSFWGYVSGAAGRSLASPQSIQSPPDFICFSVFPPGFYSFFDVEVDLSIVYECVRGKGAADPFSR